MHGQRLYGRPAELERLVGGSVGAQPADDREDEVLGHDSVGEPPADLYAKGLGHAQPRLPGGHADGDVGRAHAGGEGSERACHAGVRVGPDHHVARLGEAFGDALVADTHLDVGERRAGLVAEAPDGLVSVGELGARRGRGVIDEEHGPRHLELQAAEVAELLDGERPGAVLGQGKVDQRDHDLTGGHRVDAGVSGDDLFGERGGHGAPYAGRPGAAGAATLWLVGTASPSRPM